MALDLTDHELAFLHAAYDLASRQEELYPMLAAALGTDPYTFWLGRLVATPGGWLQTWSARRRYEQLQKGRFGRWAWVFHGLECDVWNVDDKRLVRIDFGSSTQRLVITGFGVLQYVMTVRPPWRCFEALRAFLVKHGKPYGYLSGDHAKMSTICDRLERLELLVAADPSAEGPADRLVVSTRAKSLIAEVTRLGFVPG
jgi:hypothetical protein